MLKEPGVGGGGGGGGRKSNTDMASLPHSSLADPNSPFNNQSAPSIDHSPLPSPNSACFPNTLLPEFDGHGHLPLGKFQQELAQAWQTPSPHLDKAIKMPNNSFAFADARLLSAFSIGALSNHHTFSDSPELPGNSMATGSWEANVGQKLNYASSLGSMLPASNNTNGLGNAMNLAAAQGMSGGSEFVGNLGSNVGSNGAMPSLMGTSPRLSEKAKHLNMVNSNWGSINTSGNVGLTVDPSKGALAIQGMNLAASHCLASFSTDPGFAERAAKSSCFSNQNYSELAQTYATEGGKLFNRSAARASGPPKPTRVSSGHLTPRCSAPNSPVGGARCGGSTQDPNGTSENAYFKATQEAAVVLEEPRRLEKRSGRGSSSPSRIDGSEGTQKHCTSLNDSDDADGSLGQEVSSSCERGGCAFDTASQGLSEIPGKRRRIGSKDRSKDASRAANPSEVKDLEMDEDKTKRHKSGENAKEEDQKQKVEQSNSGNSGDTTPKSVKESSKPPEAPKPDYIHVRARRGQATDSHSLAERVRREKISERMKFLQDLVPGCSKVTGKAVMLDEIINYVQSLQRQVEFLSMKLAAVNPRLEFNIDSLFGKEMIQPRGITPSLHFAPENTSSYPLLHQQAQGALQVGGSCPPVDVHSLGPDSALRRSISLPQASMDAYGDSVSQISQAWDDELLSVVQMGFAQGRQTPLSSPGIQGRMFPGQMKVEL